MCLLGARLAGSGLVPPQDAHAEHTGHALPLEQGTRHWELRRQHPRAACWASCSRRLVLYFCRRGRDTGPLSALLFVFISNRSMASCVGIASGYGDYAYHQQTMAPR